jgi:threonine-phosphate decarboxylase
VADATFSSYGHGGDIWTASVSAGLNPEEILDFSANINPLGPPPGLFDYLTEKLPEIVRYPDPECRGLQAAICQRYNPAGDILAGNGAGELIYLLPRLIAPAPVLLTAPTFTLYEKAARAAGCEVTYYMSDHHHDFSLDMDGFCREIIRAKPGLVILCNPNNPTGTLLSRKEVLAAADACDNAGSLLAVDEAFLEFYPGHDEITMLQEQKKGVVVLRSMTKMFALPGLRLGFITGDSSLLKRLNRLRDPWSVNALAQRAGEFVLADDSFTARSSALMATTAAAFAEKLRSVPGLTVYPPSANYIFLKCTTIKVSALQQKMIGKGILLRNCSNYHGLDDSYFRVAVRGLEENERLVRALHQALK